MLSQLDLIGILMMPVVAFLAGAVILSLLEFKQTHMHFDHSSRQDSQS